MMFELKQTVNIGSYGTRRCFWAVVSQRTRKEWASSSDDA